MKKFSVLIVAAFAAVACTVEVDDLTTSPLRFNPPTNEQDFRVRVRSNTRIDDVRLSVDGATSRSMSRDADGTYSGSGLVPNCASATNYSVTVDGPRISPRTFPRSGRFAREIVNVPPECEPFSGSFANTFIVNSVADFVDSDIGDGQCSGVGPDGRAGCSLRAAVMQANASPGDDLIVMENGRYPITRDIGDPREDDDTVGDLNISDTVTIQRRGGSTASVTDFLSWPGSRDLPQLSDDPSKDSRFVKIDGLGMNRIFSVQPGTTLRLRFVALVNADQAVLNRGTLTLERVALVGNSSFRAGAALSNQGSLFSTETVFARNSVALPDGSEFFEASLGGAIYNAGNMVVKRSLFAFNRAIEGSAIANENGFELENVVFHGNFGPVSTFGSTVIQNYGLAGFDDVQINHATFSSNTHIGSAGSTLLRNGFVEGRRVIDMNVRNSLFLNNLRSRCGDFESAGGNFSDIPCRPSRFSTVLLPDRFDAFGGRAVVNTRLGNLGGFFPVPVVNSSVQSRLNGTAGVPLTPLTDARGIGFPRSLTASGAPSEEGDTDAGAIEY